jgi:predicted metal-dependent peptidase
VNQEQAANSNEPPLDEQALDVARQGLRLATASMPHLAGLARLVRLKPSRKVGVAAIGASGLLVVRPELFVTLTLGDAAYIMAHELMHLALDTSGRIGDANRLVGNFAHDYIINDMLSEELDREPPLGGLYHQGASEKSFEEWIVDLSRDGEGGDDSRRRCWAPGGGQFPGRRPSQAPSPMSRALADAGLVSPEDLRQHDEPQTEIDDRGDLLDNDQESQLEPELSPQARETLKSRVRKAAAKAAGLGELSKKLEQAQQTPADEPQRHEQLMAALRAAYHTPWQLALQHWMDAVAPGQRTYARPSRRGANRTDVVLPGRRREGWTLHIILDTSGSMESYLPTALGALGHFCESAGVYDVHVVQCDTEVTRDEWLEPMVLPTYKISGFGYSDMRPAMRHLAEDPEVTAVLMLTDGAIDILDRPPPYRMLWVILGGSSGHFSPPYGDVIELAHG